MEFHLKHSTPLRVTQNLKQKHILWAIFAEHAWWSSDSEKVRSGDDIDLSQRYVPPPSSLSVSLSLSSILLQAFSPHDLLWFFFSFQSHALIKHIHLSLSISLSSVLEKLCFLFVDLFEHIWQYVDLFYPVHSLPLCSLQYKWENLWLDSMWMKYTVFLLSIWNVFARDIKWDNNLWFNCLVHKGMLEKYCVFV